MSFEETERLATAIGKAVAEAMAAAILPIILETGRKVDDLRVEVFNAMEQKVSHDECARTHIALPVVPIISGLGVLGMLQAIIITLVGYWITHRS